MLDFIPGGTISQRLAQRIFPVACCVIGLGVALAAAEQGPAPPPAITPVADASPAAYVSIPPERSRFALAADPSLSLAAATAATGERAAGVGKALFGSELMFDTPATSVHQSVHRAGRHVVDNAAMTGRAAHASKAHTVRMLVTAYCPCTLCCGPNARGITASGRSVSYHHGLFVAADVHRLPFGSKVVIPGYANGNAVEVIDTGAAMTGNHIDAFFPTHEQALAWGRRWVNVTIVDRGRGG